MTVIFLWIVFSIIVGMFASNYRNRDGGAWFLISIAISPLLAFLFLIVMKPAYSRSPYEQMLHDRKIDRVAKIGSWIPVAMASFVGFILICLAIAVAMANASHAQTQQRVLRDAGGRTIGTSSTDSVGNTVVRDAGGRTIGTESTDSRGNTTLRDAGGRTLGTISGGRR